jgi:hypothetical protein
MPVAARSEALVCRCSLVAIMVSNPTGGMDGHGCLSLMSVVC